MDRFRQFIVETLNVSVVPVPLVEGNDFALKVVKTGSSQQPVTSGGWRNRGKMKTVNEYELHHPETGEPVFKLSPGYKGNEYKLEWHDYHKSAHPGLEDSYEHGKNHHDIRHFTVSGKDQAKWVGTNIYKEAARKGFKDTLHVHHSLTNEKGKPLVSHFKDPETGETIVHQNAQEYPVKHTVNSKYLSNHGIDHDITKGLKWESGYDLAHKIYGEKGKSYNAIGIHSSDASHKVYKASGSPEEASAAHENHLIGKYSRYDNFKVTRHSPTSFVGTAHSYGTDIHFASHVHDGHIHEFHSAAAEFTKKKLEHRF